MSAYDIKPPCGIEHLLLESVRLEVKIRSHSPSQSWTNLDIPTRQTERLSASPLMAARDPSSSPLFCEAGAGSLEDYGDEILPFDPEYLFEATDTAIMATSVSAIPSMVTGLCTPTHRTPTDASSWLAADKYDIFNSGHEKNEWFDDEHEIDNVNDDYDDGDGIDDDYVEPDRGPSDDDMLFDASQAILSVIEAAIRLTIIPANACRSREYRVAKCIDFTSLSEIAPSIWVPGFMQVNRR